MARRNRPWGGAAENSRAAFSRCDERWHAFTRESGEGKYLRHVQGRFRARSRALPALLHRSCYQATASVLVMAHRPAVTPTQIQYWPNVRRFAASVRHLPAITGDERLVDGADTGHHIAHKFFVPGYVDKAVMIPPPATGHRPRQRHLGAVAALQSRTTPSSGFGSTYANASYRSASSTTPRPSSTPVAKHGSIIAEPDRMRTLCARS